MKIFTYSSRTFHLLVYCVTFLNQSCPDRQLLKSVEGDKKFIKRLFSWKNSSWPWWKSLLQHYSQAWYALISSEGVVEQTRTVYQRKMVTNKEPHEVDRSRRCISRQKKKGRRLREWSKKEDEAFCRNAQEEIQSGSTKENNEKLNNMHYSYSFNYIF